MFTPLITALFEVLDGSSASLIHYPFSNAAITEPVTRLILVHEFSEVSVRLTNHWELSNVLDN